MVITGRRYCDTCNRVEAWSLVCMAPLSCAATCAAQAIYRIP